MQKIKILHVIKSLGRGGAEILLPETLKLHNCSKFEFHYIYFLPWKDQMVEDIRKNSGKVTCLSANNNWKLILHSHKVSKYAKSNNIDVIHCHLPWSGFVGRYVYSISNIPVIYTEHNIQERYHFATKFLNKKTFNYQSLALGVSKGVTRSILENINPDIPVKTLFNGVNTSHFKFNLENRNRVRCLYNIPKDAIVLGNIAVFREQKCIPDWIRAFQLINKSNPNVYGILVGAGPKELEVKALITELGLENKVILTGLQTDTVSYFSSMDIFMMSSAFEGLPIALLEAMSTNCAIVSTKAGGVVEAIRDGKDGFLCEVGNWEQLATKAMILITDQNKRAELRLAARKRVENSFSLEKMVNTLEEIYENYYKK